ncbi:MAG: hypothetical protein NDJ89_14115 [Oligoflexia bacterium]|nr:hypothetical protein [Oligoflexia bacterium]
MRKPVPFALALSLLMASAASAAPATPPTDCSSAKEYITAHEYLRQEKDLQVPEADARKLALHIAAGCTGSANRFIRVSRLLIGSGLSSSDALKLGQDFAARSEAETETFLTVFKRAFLKEQLDLDIGASVRLAKSLTLEFEGDQAAVKNDFETVLDFCTRTDSLNLPRPQCGVFAAEIARAGQEWGGSVARPFLDAMQFLRANPGPNLSSGDALKLARELVKHGPLAPANFTQGYRYASAESGLNLARNEAVAFARELASKSRPLKKSEAK